MNPSNLRTVEMSLVMTALSIGPWAGVAHAAPIHNTFNDVWIDKETQHWYDNLTEAGANERRQASNRDIEQMDTMMSMFLNIMMDRETKRARGREVLKRDEASTGFTPAKGSPVAARMIAKLGTAAAADPKQREAVAREVVGRLGAFQAAATARGGVVKSDIADIYAVAFILNYEVLNDAAGGQAAVGAVRLWQEYRGVVEVEIPTEIARWKQITGGDTSKFGSLAGWPDQTVRSEAKRRLDAMFKFGGLTFDDYTLTDDGLEPRRGQRLIKEGKATTEFHRAPEALLPARLAAGPDAGDRGPTVARQVADELKAFANLTARRRAPADDMAHAAALAISVHYAVLSGGAELTDRQYQSLVKLLGRRYVEDPAWAALPDTARQELAETWAIRAIRNWREYRQKVDVEIPKARAEKAAMFPTADARTLDSWVANMADWVKSDARRQIESVFAPLKLDGYRLTEEGFVPAATR